MKKCAFALFVVFVAFSHGYGQSITISQKNAPLKDIFKTIEGQTSYTFFYDRQLLKDTRRVTIDVKNVSLQEALEVTFQDQPISYTIIDKIITLKQKATPPVSAGLINLVGKITNEKGEGVPGATVEIRGTSKMAVANDSGEFKIYGINASSNIIISSINYEQQEITLQGRDEVYVKLNKRIGELSDVVIVSSGYQDQVKEKTTGSSFRMNNDLLNRRVSTNVLMRLEGVTPGLVFNKNIPPNVNQTEISIRGRSTIFANPRPLIVVDNFPYSGDINNINPNDVESITILKDAAATAIWGVLSGNGVIVITTKTGKYNQPVKVSFNANVTVGGKPDLFYEPKMSSKDYIEVEQYLFDRGAYADLENSPANPALSPVVEILIAKRDGDITEAQAEAKLNELRNYDKRSDFTKAFYRNSINQQYAANASGGGNTFKYYLSAGYDRNIQNMVGNEYERKTFIANTSIALIKDKLELNTGAFISETDSKNSNADLSYVKYPYEKIMDENGNALPIYFSLRQSFVDTAGQGKLLDWNLRPLEEWRFNIIRVKNSDYRVNLGLKYTISKGLEATLLYQHNRGEIKNQNIASEQSFTARHLINTFSQIDSTGRVIRPIPVGGISDQTYASFEANNFRSQVNFIKEWDNHLLDVLGGFEIRNLEMKEDGSRQYGYGNNQPPAQNIDYSSLFPYYYAPFYVNKIPNLLINKSSTDRYISYYLNLTYTYKKRYLLSASARKDESNLFGVDANQKGVPLWSTGISWIISRENFYNVTSIPYLKFRITSGYNGNVDKSVSAYTTANIEGRNNYGAVTGSIINPPNPSLRWEKIYMLNLGLDFSSKNKRIEGSVEYYWRKGIDIIGNSPLDPTTGSSTFRGNTANIKGHGADILLTFKNLNKTIKWQTTLLFSHAIDKVTSYKQKQATIGRYLDSKFINPLQGNPLYSIYGLTWMGLDPLTGDPQGLLNNIISKDYNSINNSANFEDLKYIGPAAPTYFGSIRNTFTWKQFELSFTLAWKAGYYFRNNSVDYYTLFLGNPDHPDYANRWKKPGDEQITNVPSMPSYPATDERNLFYKYSTILIEKGDHIRLQDIQISYNFTKNQIPKLPMQSIRVYLYTNNLGIIWKANKKGIDPDYLSGYPDPRTISGGIKINF